MIAPVSQPLLRAPFEKDWTVACTAPTRLERNPGTLN